MVKTGKVNDESLKGYFTTVVLIVAGGFFFHDIVTDIARGHESRGYMAVEAAIFTVVMIALWLEIRRTIQLRQQVSKERDRVARLSGELFHNIEKAFDRWRLTNSEREVAIMLIKGMSMAEIGAVREVKDKTIRQHATNIYAKAGYSNRNELASHFIEDLLSTTLGVEK